MQAKNISELAHWSFFLALQSFETSGNTHPTTKHYIPADLNSLLNSLLYNNNNNNNSNNNKVR